MFQQPLNPAASGSDDSRPAVGTADRSLIVSLARDIWRLRGAIDRAKSHGKAPEEAVAAVLDRLQEDLDAGGVVLVDPTAQAHDPGARYEVAYVEANGEGPLYVSETLSPGVRVRGKLVAVATVVLAHGGK